MKALMLVLRLVDSSRGHLHCSLVFLKLMDRHLLMLDQVKSCESESVCVCTGCVSLVLKSEAAGFLIAPWWLAAVQVINPALSM